MLALQRQRHILTLIQQTGAVRVADLAKEFGVTEETIRRDLTMLENAGRVTRSHGGAVLAQSERREVPHQQREVINKTAKIQIAQSAVQRIQIGDTILLDASSSVLFLAHLIPDIAITVITNSLLVMQALAHHTQIRLLSMGGVFTPISMSLTGPLTEKNLRDYHVNKMFFSCRGVDVQRGFSDPNDGIARLKQQMLEISDERILLVDHGKLDVRALSVIADLSAVTEIITDSGADTAYVERIRETGVTVTQVPQDERVALPSET